MHKTVKGLHIDAILFTILQINYHLQPNTSSPLLREKEGLLNFFA